MSQPSFISSFSGRLLLLGVLPAVLVIAAIVGWSAVDGYRNMQQAEERVLAADAGGAVAELNTRNDRWNYVVATMAANQGNGLFGRRKETSDYAMTMVSLSDLILSGYFIYEPNADGQDAASLKSAEVPHEAIDTAGRFMPVWYRDSGAGEASGKLRLRPATGVESMDAYLAAKGSFARTGKAVATITEPHAFDGGLMVSHVFPIVVQGKFAGIAAVDRTIDKLTEIVGEIKKRSGVDVFVLSPGGVFIAATTDAAKKEAGADTLKMRRISETPYAPMGSQWLSVTVGNDIDIFKSHDPVLGEECFYAVEKTGVGGWTVVARRSKAEVMAGSNTTLVRNIFLGALGIFLVGVMSLNVIRKVIALVGNVKQASIRLNSTATEVGATSKQQEASSATFGAASSQIAAAVKEISATGHDLVKTMESVNRIAVETTDLAGAGRAGLHGMEQVMRDLDGATVSIAGKLSEINERSQKITTVITTITKVADQTNILSINAAIEAEKAGEYGAGFLVIAREIRRLADQTATATLDIEQMVQQMQGSVSSGVMEMDRFADKVRRGVRDVASAGSQLTEIIDRVNRSTESFKQVNESMQAQSQGAQQISDAMGALVTNANQTMQSVQEFGRAAADLQSAIATLREAVAQFKLRE